MSHFSLAVITRRQPTDARLMEILQPWHEFECTGKDDQYIVEIDKTEEARQAYETARMTFIIQEPDGSKHNAFDKSGDFAVRFRHFLDPMSRKFELPEGYVQLDDELAKDWESLAEWAEGYYGTKPVAFGEQPELEGRHKYGYMQLGENGELVKLVKRTNPNAKWDWWVVGGRYAGRLKTKSGHCNGNQARIGDLDLEALRREAVFSRANALDTAIDQLRSKNNCSTVEIEEAWKSFVVSGGIAGLKERQPVGVAIQDYFEKIQPEDPARKAFEMSIVALFCGLFGVGVPDTEPSLSDWAKSAPPLTTFAVVNEGQWFQLGEMGWWGIVSDKMDEAEWEQSFVKLLEELDPEYWITYVDCHI